MSIERSPLSDDGLQVAQVLEPGSVVVRAVEIVQYLHPDGQELIACRWQGDGNVLVEFGMLEYAKQELALARFRLAEDDDEEPT